MKRIALIICSLLSCVILSAQTIEPFKNGDRVVFFGDSITDGGHYHSFIWLYYMTRFPNMQLDIFNAGVGGDKVDDMYARLDDDALCHKPTVMLVNFGMNDSGYDELFSEDIEAVKKQKLESCKTSYEKLEARLKSEKDLRVVMLNSTPYDGTVVKEDIKVYPCKDEIISLIGEMQYASAMSNGWEFLDMHSPLAEITKERQAADPKFTLTLDRIHPDNHGHMIMVYNFLKAQGFAGKKVADIEIDATTAKLVKSENCKIKKLQCKDGVVAFDYLATALPYPLDQFPRGWNFKHSQAEITEYVPFVEEMNQEMLKVNGLEGRYELVIDGHKLAIFEGRQLAEGINMAELTDSPQYQQAVAVMRLNEWRWEIERHFREVALMEYTFLRPYGLTKADNDESIAKVKQMGENSEYMEFLGRKYFELVNPTLGPARANEMRFLRDEIYRVNKPQLHRIELIEL